MGVVCRILNGGLFSGLGNICIRPIYRDSIVV
jgi:hypothetical protein